MTIEERLSKIEANVALLIEMVQAIATELGVRAKIRILSEKIEDVQERSERDTIPDMGASSD